MPKLKNPNGPYWQALEAAEKKIIWDTLALTKGDVKNAARLLCISRNYLRNRINHLGIDVDLLREGTTGRPKPQEQPAAEPKQESWLASAAKETP